MPLDLALSRHHCRKHTCSVALFGSLYAVLESVVPFRLAFGGHPRLVSVRLRNHDKRAKRRPLDPVGHLAAIADNPPHIASRVFRSRHIPDLLLLGSKRERANCDSKSGAEPPASMRCVLAMENHLELQCWTALSHWDAFSASCAFLTTNLRPSSSANRTYCASLLGATSLRTHNAAMR